MNPGKAGTCHPPGSGARGTRQGDGGGAFREGTVRGCRGPGSSGAGRGLREGSPQEDHHIEHLVHLSVQRVRQPAESFGSI